MGELSNVIEESLSGLGESLIWTWGGQGNFMDELMF